MLTLFGRWLAVATRFALHEYELDVILNYRIWLVGLAKKFGAVRHLIIGIAGFRAR